MHDDVPVLPTGFEQALHSRNDLAVHLRHIAGEGISGTCPRIGEIDTDDRGLLAEADAPLVARLAKLGIVPGQDFDIAQVGAAAARGLEQAPKAAQEKIMGHFKEAGVDLNGWTFSTKTGLYGTDYLQRAFITAIGLGANRPQDAVYPTARDHLNFPEHLAEGIEPHKVREVLLWGSNQPNFDVDITDDVDRKIEALTAHELRHGEAVAIGLALDTRYSVQIGMLPPGGDERVYALLKKLGFYLWHPLMESRDAEGHWTLLRGLEEFREHLGGELTITLLREIGQGEEVHHMDADNILRAIAWLHRREAGQ